MFFIIKKSEETIFQFSQNPVTTTVADLVYLWDIYKMETQKIVNLLNNSDNEYLNLLTIKFH